MTKGVLRLLTAKGELLTWTEIVLEARGDGCLWPAKPLATFDPVERAGAAVTLSLHWCAVNVETRVPLMPSIELTEGQVIDLPLPGPLLRIGAQASGLPPVTIRRPVTVGVPVGVLAAVGG